MEVVRITNKLPVLRTPCSLSSGYIMSLEWVRRRPLVTLDYPSRGTAFRRYFPQTKGLPALKVESREEAPGLAAGAAVQNGRITRYAFLRSNPNPCTHLPPSPINIDSKLNTSIPSNDFDLILVFRFYCPT